jgi:hypothetical protein
MPEARHRLLRRFKIAVHQCLRELYMLNVIRGLRGPAIEEFGRLEVACLVSGSRLGCCLD